MAVVPILLLLVQGLDLLSAELFTSNAHLQTALYAERDIAGLLLNYVEQEEARLARIRRLADDYERHSSSALENIDAFLGNPINAFLLIKRFTLDWDRDVIPVISNGTWEAMSQQIDQVRVDLPTYEDLKGAAAALMRLQDTYQLDASTVAQGKLAGLKSPVLSVEDCFELGRLAYNAGDFYHTVLWMEQALSEHRKNHNDRRAPGIEGNGHISSEVDSVQADILDYLAFSQYKSQQSCFSKIVLIIAESEDCFLLGRLSYVESDYYHSSLWMQAALERDSQELQKTASKSEILDYLSYTKAMLGDVAHALELTIELLKLEPNHERAVNNKKYFEAMLQDKTKKQELQADKKPGYQLSRDEYRNSEEFLTYEALCRGEDIMPIANQEKLVCRYVTNNHPLLLLQPAKEEIVHWDPYLVIYHDVMSDEEIKQIKHMATPRLNRATVQNSKTGELETANYRISKSAWLNGKDHPVVERLNDRMSAITGLEMSTAEELQIANYGLGGHYEPHYDFARREEKDAFKSLGTGNRIATFLNYMSDVQAGGATVFPYLGLKLYPKKGDAAFWYNLYKNGSGIYSTRHAACPVLVGTKWVANKWIHERGQEFKRPCGLHAEE
ncbi:unnamed protein product [Candidula unifasciata]|uniref:procollagen-proline 4-dioxygenase n=1 Tax=Candidula unifasciata TaxID=100452 RepID=A0A8S3Z557_9EUPU|nr:unnamed protein product [Candidula unifasciata]